MKGLMAFLKKEFFELFRSGRLIIFGIIFLLIGIMNPAIAKLMPKLFEMAAETIESQGLIVKDTTVTAMDSWAQFVKNIPIAVIVTLIMFSGMFTNEYSKGTLIPIITKGLSRNSVVLAKSFVMLTVWTLGFWLCYGISYAYTAYYWDNSIVSYTTFMALCWWIMGIFLLCILTFFSAFSSSGVQVMLGVGGVYVAMYLMNLFAKIKEYLPTYILSNSSLLTAQSKPEDYFKAIIITVVLSMIALIASLPIMHKRQL